MLIFKLEYILIGKDIIYRMLLYHFVYFLRKITTDKHAILSNLEKFPCYLPMVDSHLNYSPATCDFLDFNLGTTLVHSKSIS